MKNTIIDINGLKIHYREEGKGDPLIILHGWGISSENFLELQKVLAKKLRVINIDLPGFGQSDLPTEPWEVGDYAVMAREFVDKLKLKKIYLFGHSFGGRVAIKFAVRYPEILKGLILCNSAGIKPKISMKRLVFKTVAKTGKIVCALPILSKLSPIAKKILYRAAKGNDYLKLENEIMKKTFIKIIDEDLTSLLSTIATKTLILWGKDDRLTPLKDGLLMEHEIKDSVLQVFPGIGHKLPYARPKEVGEEVGRWIGSRF